MSTFTGGGAPTPWNVWSEPNLHLLLVLVSIPAVVVGALALARRSLLSVAVPASLLAGSMVVAVLAAPFMPGSIENALLYVMLGWATFVGAAPFVRTEAQGLRTEFPNRPTMRAIVALVGAASALIVLIMSSWTAGANYASAEKQDWRDLADDVARVDVFGWPVLIFPSNTPVTAALLTAYRPGVLDHTHISIGANNELPRETARGLDALWLASIASPGLGDVEARLEQAGYHRLMSSGQWYDLFLDLYLRDGARVGSEIPINGNFQGAADGADGWWISSSGASFAPAEGGGREITLANYKNEELIASQEVPAEPDHLYVLEFEARARPTQSSGSEAAETGTPKAFLICTGEQGRWLQVAPYGFRDIIPGDGAWHEAGVAALCPAGTSNLSVHIRNSGHGEVDYRHIRLQDVAP